MSERLDLADAVCPARFQPNFQGGEAKGEDRPENAGLKTRDAPIRNRAARQDERSEVRAPIRLLVQYRPHCLLHYSVLGRGSP